MSVTAISIAPLAELAAGPIYGFMLVLSRIGTALMLMPGFGEVWLSMRVRLAFAVMLALTVLPLVLNQLPAPPAAPSEMAAQVAWEFGVGLWFGLCTRLIASAMLVGGTIIAMQSGMANVMLPGAVSPDATAIVGTWLGVALLAFIFTSGLDHILLTGLIESYKVVPPPGPGHVFPMTDMAEAITRVVSGSFLMGVKISMPFLASALAVNAAFGLANRFMPQLQAYFLSTPVTIVIMAVLLGIVIPAILDMARNAYLAFLTTLTTVR